ncbi:MAG: ribosomal protein S18-alanine N-acetyltransferase [Spirochaetes bacterium]|nr:ribosomal protein S18-alanine N-acetyltransferase [Spirochaetota bacterium]
MYNIKNTEISDLNAVFGIESSLFSQGWSINQLQDEITNSGSVFKVLILNGIVIGYYIINAAIDTCEIYKIAVADDYQKCGYGSILLEDIYRETANMSVARIYLEVAETNIKAVNFYIKNGFRKIHVRKNYYGNESAYIMEKYIQ